MVLGRVISRLVQSAQRSYSSGGHTYKAAVLKEFNKPLIIEEMKRPATLKPNQIRVGVSYCSMNYVDAKAFEGDQKYILPIVPGGELSGEILELGGGVDKSEFKVGDRVVGLTGWANGGLAEEAVVDKLDCWTLSNISLKNAAILPYGHGTALLAFTKYSPINENDIVIVLAGPAGLGLGAIEVASSVFKAKVIAVCDTEDSSGLIRDEGAYQAVSISEGVPAVYKYLRDAVGKNRAAVIYDAVGQGHVHTFQDFLCPTKGQLLSVYPLFDLERFKTEIPKGEIKKKYKLETSFTSPIENRLQHVDLLKFRNIDPDFYRQIIDDTFALYDEELISAHVSKTFPLAEVNEAIDYIRKKKCTGKVLIDIKKQKPAPSKEADKKEKDDD